MNGRVLHQEEVVRVHVATTTTTTAASSTSNNGRPPPPPRRAILLDQRGGRIAGPLLAEAGGEFTFELIENYPSLGLSAVQDGSGTIINWRGMRGNSRVQRCNRREKDFLEQEANRSPRTRPSVLDPYLPTFQHLLCDLDLVTSSLHLKNYPVCENDVYDVNSECRGGPHHTRPGPHPHLAAGAGVVQSASVGMYVYSGAIQFCASPTIPRLIMEICLSQSSTQ